MKKKIKLINAEDLKIILHIDDQTIADYIEKGMPNYYFENTIYFNFQEVMDWVCSCLDLGYLSCEARTVLGSLGCFLEDKKLTYETLLEKLKELQYKEYGSNELLVFLKHKLTHRGFGDFRKALKDVFPYLSERKILNYYIGILKDTYLDSCRGNSGYRETLF